MDIKTLSPNQIRNIGFDALVKELGPVGMVRFLQYFETGTGDYTKERHHWLDEQTVQDVVKTLKERR
ncbi:MAG: hypothetical protein HYZ34_13425 [Ignavibacteriae bacterium]|nr:hypothetical protein [Ignavibacteriota bacterium]